MTLIVASAILILSSFTVIGFSSATYTFIEGVDKYVSLTITRLENIYITASNITIIIIPGTADGTFAVVYK